MTARLDSWCSHPATCLASKGFPPHIQLLLDKSEVYVEQNRKTDKKGDFLKGGR